jgi:hypothetical protein
LAQPLAEIFFQLSGNNLTLLAQRMGAKSLLSKAQSRMMSATVTVAGSAAWNVDRVAGAELAPFHDTAH